jgi:hypothetical protein
MVAAEIHSDRSEGGKMKAVRTHDYAIQDYGKISFGRRDAGSGHVVYRVIWTRAGESIKQAIAWLQPGQKPTAELALFYCKVACAKEDGLDQYHYHDQGLRPPKRMLRQRNAA